MKFLSTSIGLAIYEQRNGRWSCFAAAEPLHVLLDLTPEAAKNWLRSQGITYEWKTIPEGWIA